MIAVFGLGFVGLTTALGFAEKGFRVHGFEADAARAQSLAAGAVPFYEPMLEEKLRQHAGVNFFLCATAEEALRAAEAVFLCVGTPQDADGRADLRDLRAALDAVIAHTPKGRFRAVIVKSTVPPGTTHHELRAHLEQAGRKCGVDLGLASNPEFLREGLAWDDFLRADRVVLGVDDEKSAELLKKIYAPFGAPVHVLSPNTAEFVKYLSNALLATLISFSNEMAMIAGAAGGIDIARAFRILHEDRRWSGRPAAMTGYAWPGAGFGGYCLPKDVAALRARARELGAEAPLLDAVLSVNAAIKRHVAGRVAAAAQNKAMRIGILGLSFKPGSDDVRDSPAAAVIAGLRERGFGNIAAYDPMATASFRKAYPDLRLRDAGGLDRLCAESDLLVLLTAWPEFRDLPRDARRKLLDFRYFLGDGAAA